MSDIIEKSEFIDAVREGFFTDDDGFGYYGNDKDVTHVKKVYPSEILFFGWAYKEATHVHWFNK